MRTKRRLCVLILALIPMLFVILATDLDYSKQNIGTRHATRTPQTASNNISGTHFMCMADRLLVDPKSRTVRDNTGADVIPLTIVPLMLDVYAFQEVICNISVPMRRLVLVQNMEEPVLTAYLNELEALFGWSGRLLVRRYPENIGYSGAVNVGLRLAMSLPREEVPFVFITNSDVQFSPDLLPRLLRDIHNLTAHDAARMDELAAEVAREPSEHSPPNRPLKVLRSPDGKGALSTSALLPDRIRYAPKAERQKAFADHYAIFATKWNFTSVFISRLAISTVGFFDENFFPAYFEDPDFGWRTMALGFRKFEVPYGTLLHNMNLNLRIMKSTSHLSKSAPSLWWRRIQRYRLTFAYARLKWNTAKGWCCRGYDEPFNGRMPVDVWVLDEKRIKAWQRYGSDHRAKLQPPSRLYDESLIRDFLSRG